MNFTIDSLKSYEHFDKADLQSATAIVTAMAIAASSSILSVVTTAITTVGLFPKVPHKKHSVDFHPAFTGYYERLNKTQKHLDQGIEKWDNINNQPDSNNISKTTVRP